MFLTSPIAVYVYERLKCLQYGFSERLVLSFSPLGWGRSWFEEHLCHFHLFMVFLLVIFPMGLDHSLYRLMESTEGKGSLLD